jgi:hypothetical protein
MQSGARPIKVFYSYSHNDRDLRDLLGQHLALLRHQRIIIDWHDRQITAGMEWKDQIDQYLESAELILLLISPAFLDSDYCYDIEMKRAMERHENGEVRVIPVLLRPVDWEGAIFSKLQCLPTDARPVTSWSDRDMALHDIARGIRKVSEELRKDNSRSQVGKFTLANAPRENTSTVTAQMLDPLSPPSETANGEQQDAIKSEALQFISMSLSTLKNQWHLWLPIIALFFMVTAAIVMSRWEFSLFESQSSGAKSEIGINEVPNQSPAIDNRGELVPVRIEVIGFPPAGVYKNDQLDGKTPYETLAPVGSQFEIILKREGYKDKPVSFKVRPLDNQYIETMSKIYNP